MGGPGYTKGVPFPHKGGSAVQDLGVWSLARVTPVFETCSPSARRAVLKFSSELNYSVKACDGVCMQVIHQALDPDSLHSKRLS